MPQPQPQQQRCVIYARYSSSNQREESITAQVRAMTAYAEASGYTVVATYTDEARSATTDDRPNFQRLIADITTRRVRADVVLVHKLDRFARNRYDAAFYRRELRQHGVRLESVLERLDDSPESVILESLLEGMAEYYSANLAREVRKGMTETALQCKHAGGRPPLGLRVAADRTYEIDEATAPAVRLIFARFAAGAHYNAIAEQLNALGYTTRGGKPFRKASLHDILANPKYIGTYIFNRSAPKSPDGRRNHHRSKTPEEIITIPDAFPALIDRATWDACQARLSARQLEHAPGAAKAKRIYLLSGMCTCGVCGARMVAQSQSYHTRVSREWRQRAYYVCGHSRPPERCQLPRVPHDALERAVVAAVKRQIFTPDGMARIARRAAAYARDLQRERSGEGEYLARELANLDAKTGRIVEAIASGAGAMPALVAELQRLDGLASGLRQRLAEWERSRGMVVTEEMIVASLHEQASALDGDDPERLRALLHCYVIAVVVYPDGTADIQLRIQPAGGAGGDQDCGFAWWRRAVPVHIRSRD